MGVAASPKSFLAKDSWQQPRKTPSHAPLCSDPASLTPCPGPGRNTVYLPPVRFTGAAPGARGACPSYPSPLSVAGHPPLLLRTAGVSGAAFSALQPAAKGPERGGEQGPEEPAEGPPSLPPSTPGPILCVLSASAGRQNTPQLLRRWSESIRTQSTALGFLLIKCLHLNCFPPEGNTLTREEVACAGRAGPTFCQQLPVPARHPRPQPAPAPCLGSRATGHAPHTRPVPPSCSGAWENADAPWPG